MNDKDRDAPGSIEEFVHWYADVPDLISADKYARIPCNAAKPYIFAHNLKNGSTLEENQLKLVFYVLALRHYKNYNVRLESAESLAWSDQSAVLYLNNEILAVSSKYSIFYTDDIFIARHRETLGLYGENLETGNFFERLNATEKTLVAIWLDNIREVMTEQQALMEISLLEKLLGGLEGAGEAELHADRGGMRNFLGETISFLPYGMDLTVVDYDFRELVSDLFLKDSKRGDDEIKYLFLDTSLLGNSEITENLTVLNHVKYFEIRGRFRDENDLKWILTNEYKIKIPANCHIILQARKYFTDRVSLLDKPLSREMALSEKNLFLDEVLVLYPVKNTLLDIFNFEEIHRFASAERREDAVCFRFKWTLNAIHIISTMVYNQRYQINISKLDLAVKFFPEYELEGLTSYEIQYILKTKDFRVYPYSYMRRDDNTFITDRLTDIHFILYDNALCGFFKTKHKILRHTDSEQQITVHMKCYPGRIIYHFQQKDGESGQENNMDGALYGRKNIHLMCYAAETDGKDGPAELSAYEYLGDGLTKEKLALLDMNRFLGMDLIGGYHWDFDGKTYFLLSRRDLDRLIRKIFIELLAAGYQKRNIYWEVDFYNLLTKISEPLFRNNLDELLADASLLQAEKEGHGSREYGREDYLDENVRYPGAADVFRRIFKDQGGAGEGAICIYLSDYTVFAEYGRGLFPTKAGRRVKLSGGLLDILKMLSRCGRDVLELFDLDGHEKDLSLLHNENYQGLLLNEFERYELSLQHQYYQQGQRDLIFIITCLVIHFLRSVYHLCGENRKTAALIFDRDSLVLGFLEKTQQYEVIAEIISETTAELLGLNFVYTGGDYLGDFLVMQYLREGSALDEAAIIDLACADLLNRLFREKLGWDYEDSFITALRRNIPEEDFVPGNFARGNFAPGLLAVEEKVLMSREYYRNSLSLLKDIAVAGEADRLNGREGEEFAKGMYRTAFIGQKQLVSVRSFSELPGDDWGPQFFHGIYIGGKSSQCPGVMLMPAIIENGRIIEKGLIACMNESTYLKEPEALQASDFISLNEENAKTAANATNRLLNYLKKRFDDKNQSNHNTICQLKETLETREHFIAKLENKITGLEGDNALKDGDIGKLKASIEHYQKILQEKEAELVLAGKRSFTSVMLREFNNYINTKDSRLNFFSKYKKNPVVVERTENGAYLFKKSLFNSNSLYLIEIEGDHYALLPGKRNLRRADYRKFLEDFYDFGITATNADQWEKYRMTDLALLNRRDNFYILQKKGRIAIKETAL